MSGRGREREREGGRRWGRKGGMRVVGAAAGFLDVLTVAMVVVVVQLGRLSGIV